MNSNVFWHEILFDGNEINMVKDALVQAFQPLLLQREFIGSILQGINEGLQVKNGCEGPKQRIVAIRENDMEVLAKILAYCQDTMKVSVEWQEDYLKVQRKLGGKANEHPLVKPELPKWSTDLRWDTERDYEAWMNSLQHIKLASMDEEAMFWQEV